MLHPTQELEPPANPVRFRSIGAYDNSLIVLKSDHGEPVPYFDKHLMESFKIHGHPLWGFGRYAPFLAIKPKSRVEDELTFSDRVVVLGDLARTVCLHSQLSASGCEEYSGVDLAAVGGEEQSNDYWIYIVRDAESNWVLGTHDALNLPRTLPVFAALNDRLTSEILRRMPLCDRPIPLTTDRPYNNGWTDDESWVSWFDAGTFYLKTTVADCGGVPLKLLLDAAAMPFEPQDFTVAIRAAGATDWQDVTGVTAIPEGLTEVNLPAVLAGAELEIAVAGLGESLTQPFETIQYAPAAE